MIRNLLTLEDTAKSIDKTMTTQRRTLDFLTEGFLDNKIAHDYLLVELGGDCTNTTWLHNIPKLKLLGKLKLNYIKSNKPFNLKRWLLSWGLGNHVSSVLQMWEIILLIHNHNNLAGVLCSVKSFKCMFTGAKNQAEDLLENETSKKKKKELKELTQ